MDSTGQRRVYIISDLHLGGEYGPSAEARGFRINTQVQQLASFVEDIAKEPGAELVINGDMVDFLAESDPASSAPKWSPFTSDPQLACAKLRAIAARDPQFFAALGGFLEAGHRLTILTGNHDIELSLPPVRAVLKQIIGVKPQHDYELIDNGEAYVVGDALIEHGNRYDKWNTVDHDALRHLACFLSRREDVPQNWVFQPPAGSQMVSDVINPIKQDYKFVDLLKPETECAVPLLLALEPGYRNFLVTAAKLAFNASDHKSVATGTFTHGGDIHSAGAPAASTGSDMGARPAASMSSMGGMAGGMGSMSRPAPPRRPDDAAVDTLLAKYVPDPAAFQSALQPATGRTGGDISSGIVDRTMSLARLVFARDNEDVGRRMPALLNALKALQPEGSFDLGRETGAEYLDNARRLSARGFRYVIFGHTHMAKRVDLGSGCWYLNSGTWADLMRLPEDILNASEDQARARLDPFVLSLAQGALTPWITFRPTYVQLVVGADGRVESAELLTYGQVAGAAQ